jgi:Na+/H+ antiporter NhaD/arsenite permease-like protein
MDLAVVCLIVLVVVLLVSCVSNLNVGLAALASAWVIGAYVAPHYNANIDVGTVIAGFPVKLFLDLAGTTLLFAAAQVNGTLNLLVDAAVRLCDGRARLLPLLYFILAGVLAGIGPGNIAAAALLAPSALALAARLNIPPLVMIIAVTHGSIAGGASTLTPIGLIIADNYRKHGLEDAFTSTITLNAVVNGVLALIGFLIFGGRWWLKTPAAVEAAGPDADRRSVEIEHPATTLSRSHLVTLAAVVGLIVAALFFKNLNLGFAAITAAVVVFVTRSADETSSIRSMPWNVILLVVGVSTFVALCEKTGAVDLISRSMKYVADERTVAGWSAFVTGVISIFSSTSGVVLPTFLPAVGDIVHEVGGGDPASVATAIVIGSNAVDVSPLSTIGALCIAAAAKTFDTRPLFNRMLLWGFAMAPLAAIVCQVLLR